jgi:hypothetical protein
MVNRIQDTRCRIQTQVAGNKGVCGDNVEEEEGNKSYFLRFVDQGVDQIPVDIIRL